MARLHDVEISLEDILAIEAEAIALGMQTADATPELAGFGYEAEAAQPATPVGALDGLRERALQDCVEALAFVAVNVDWAYVTQAEAIEGMVGQALAEGRAVLAAASEPAGGGERS